MRNIKKLHRLFCKLDLVLRDILHDEESLNNQVCWVEQALTASTPHNNYRILYKAAEASQLRYEILNILREEFAGCGCRPRCRDCGNFYTPNKTNICGDCWGNLALDIQRTKEQWVELGEEANHNEKR